MRPSSSTRSAGGGDSTTEVSGGAIGCKHDRPLLPRGRPDVKVTSTASEAISEFGCSQTARHRLGASAVRATRGPVGRWRLRRARGPDVQIDPAYIVASVYAISFVVVYPLGLMLVARRWLRVGLRYAGYGALI